MSGSLLQLRLLYLQLCLQSCRRATVFSISQKLATVCTVCSMSHSLVIHIQTSQNYSINMQGSTCSPFKRLWHHLNDIGPCNPSEQLQRDVTVYDTSKLYVLNELNNISSHLSLNYWTVFSLSIHIQLVQVSSYKNRLHVPTLTKSMVMQAECI